MRRKSYMPYDTKCIHHLEMLFTLSFFIDNNT